MRLSRCQTRSWTCFWTRASFRLRRMCVTFVHMDIRVRVRMCGCACVLTIIFHLLYAVHALQNTDSYACRHIRSPVVALPGAKRTRSLASHVNFKDTFRELKSIPKYAIGSAQGSPSIAWELRISVNIAFDFKANIERHFQRTSRVFQVPLWYGELYLLKLHEQCPRCLLHRQPPFQL